MAWPVLTPLASTSKSISNQRNPVNASIDSDSCTGCEECVISCPDVFSLNMTTYLAEVSTAEIPAELEGAVSSAAADCPVSAILVS